ncbi:hypothetical protein HNQ09_002163 [Deinococcus budaensis]|uniref:Uncharacterized protein n=1 Tax=Deinococcus budaensis TaxID=1665626 RepID=A0A7W8GFP2_9DEIO|nr:hypothetical protein [Deinococcus budaensis]MBB5234720.1 hypothetical protein [Deinococcus budaensis]
MAIPAAQVFELSVLGPGGSRPSRDVSVLTASLIADNTLMNYTLILPANSRGRPLDDQRRPSAVGEW